jgi:hypothetical protein
MEFGIPIKLRLLCWSRGIKLDHVMQFLRDTGMKFNVAAHARNFIFVARKPIPRLFSVLVVVKLPSHSSDRSFVPTGLDPPL